MNSPSKISSANGPGSNKNAASVLEDMDTTLRLIATLPVPAGLDDRVFAGVMAAPRPARILKWPRPLYAQDWMRSIAAAAIVVAVGGGGWGIYAHVEPNQPARTIASPRRIFQPGGFSSAEMIRRPQTLNGPTVKKTAPATAEKAQAAERAKLKKPAASAARARHRSKMPQDGSQVAK
jgi:hypothetical protein